MPLQKCVLKKDLGSVMDTILKEPSWNWSVIEQSIVEGWWSSGYTLTLCRGTFQWEKSGMSVIAAELDVKPACMRLDLQHICRSKIHVATRHDADLFAELCAFLYFHITLWGGNIVSMNWQANLVGATELVVAESATLKMLEKKYCWKALM